MCLKLDGNVQNGTEATEMGGEYQIICEAPFLLCQSPIGHPTLSRVNLYPMIQWAHMKHVVGR